MASQLLDRYRRKREVPGRYARGWYHRRAAVERIHAAMHDSLAERSRRNAAAMMESLRS